MPRIDVGDIVLDEDFSQPEFKVYRMDGEWVNSRWVSKPTVLSMTGTILPTSTKDLKQIPEGDQIEGAITIHTTQLLLSSHIKGGKTKKNGVADEIEWDGERYKVSWTRNLLEFGYCKAIATRKLGA